MALPDYRKVDKNLYLDDLDRYFRMKQGSYKNSAGNMINGQVRDYVQPKQSQSMPGFKRADKPGIWTDDKGRNFRLDYDSYTNNAGNEIQGFVRDYINNITNSGDSKDKGNEQNNQNTGFEFEYDPISFEEAKKQVQEKLDPIYQRAVSNVNKQQYQNELDAGEYASKRGIAHSGLAEDQQNKIAIAAASNISDLDAQRSSQSAEMAQSIVDQDKSMEMRLRDQAFNEYMANLTEEFRRDQFDYQKERDQVADNRYEDEFDYRKEQDRLNRLFREYQYNNMSASEKAQLDWMKSQFGEEMAWQYWNANKTFAAQDSYNQAMTDYYNSNFSGGGGGGDYSNTWKSKSASKSPTFSAYQNHLKKAINMGGVPANWARDLTELVGRESSWNARADNPTSTAYGYGQFLDSTEQNYEKKTGLNYDNPVHQLVMMAQYVKDRYGSPAKALQFWDKNHWY